MAPGIIKAFGMNEDGLRQLTIRTYITVGARDTQTPPKDNAEFAAKYIPNAELAVIPGEVDHEIFVNECDEEGRDEFPGACDPSVGRRGGSQVLRQEFAQGQWKVMIGDWLFNLPVVLMAIIVFAGTYLAAVIYFAVMRLAVNDRARAFKALSPGMLPPLGIIFGLLVGFTAAQVWSDFEKAQVAVATEASALRSFVLLAAKFPPEQESQLRILVSEHIEEAVNQEWPAMAQQHASYATSPRS